jgi:hypothetical protein
VAGDGQLDVRDHRLDLVHVQVLQLVPGGEHDAVPPDAVGAVEQVAGVQLQKAPQHRGLVRRVRGRSRADLHGGGHHRAIHADGHHRLDIPLGYEQEGPVLVLLEGPPGGEEERLYVLDGSRHVGIEGYDDAPSGQRLVPLA